MESRLALESVTSRPRVQIPGYLTVGTGARSSAIRGIDQDAHREVTEQYANDVSTAYAIPVDDLFLGMTAFNSQGIAPVDDKGEIMTTIDATDSWRINTTLSWIPSHLRTVDKTLGVSSHFPKNGTMELTLENEVSLRRKEASVRAVAKAAREGTYLLMDSRLPRHSSDGHLMPKSWLWDVYDEVGRRLDPDCNTGDAETINQRTCITLIDGCIVYGRNREGMFLDLEGGEYSLDEFSLVSTKVTDDYTKRVRVILQELYDAGMVHFPGEVPPSFSRVSERLWRPNCPTYPSVVEVHYN